MFLFIFIVVISPPFMFPFLPILFFQFPINYNTFYLVFFIKNILAFFVGFALFVTTVLLILSWPR
jgi:hypothetical protein